MNLLIKNISKRLPKPIFYFIKNTYYNLINLRLKKRQWKDIEYFDESWQERIEIMSKMIDDTDTSIIDFGCGKMWLKKFIDKKINYIGVDYIKRSPDCLICDFNKDEFPEQKADVYFLSGVLEYIEDVDSFLKKISDGCNKVIISYCTTDLSPNISFRKNMGWVNNLSKTELESKFDKNKFVLLKTQVNKSNEIFKFIKK